MNTESPRTQVRRSILVTLVISASLLVVGCSTTTASLGSSEKSSSYAELHRMMKKVADESAQTGIASSPAMVSALSVDLGATGRLASNP
jgi:hypothetical protein